MYITAVANLNFHIIKYLAKDWLDHQKSNQIYKYIFKNQNMK